MQLSEKYLLDGQGGFWRNGEEKEFAYSDGDAIEQRIGEIVRNCSDPSVLSEEIAAAITDWPSLYHLGKGRVNLLRPFLHIFSGKTLEIGCGCGAITRALGENGGEILALEGSATRAGIAASRSRGLKNVTVICESLDQFEHEGSFDVVTLIGVLEYARKYFNVAPTGDPVIATIEKARSFLRPGGILLIAIENQLGLKYLAGSPEDHNGIPMYGVEDLYGGSDVVTFGEDELSRLLGQAGLPSQQWWYPFPDYKFPVSIFSEAGIHTKSCDLTPLLQNSVGADPQRAPTSFSLESAWAPVFRNGLAGALANSFIALASDAPFVNDEEKVLAYHYASSRRQGFAKQVSFVERPGGRVRVRHAPLFDAPATSPGGKLAISFEETDFISGRHWQKELISLLNTPGWSLQNLEGWAATWYHEFLKHTQLAAQPALGKHAVVSGKHFDAVPRNLIVKSNGDGVFFDQEWVLDKPCPLGFIIFRSLGLSFFGTTSVAEPQDGATLQLRDILLHLSASVGVALADEDLPYYVQLENEIQVEVGTESSAGLTEELFADWRLNVRVKGWNPANQYRLEAAILSKDQELDLLGNEIHRLESVVRAKQELVHKLGRELANLHEATSQEGQPLEVIVQEKDQRLQELGDELNRLHQALLLKDDALAFQATEIQRLESVVQAKQEIVHQLGRKLANLHETTSHEGQRLEAFVQEKDQRLRELGDELNRLQQAISLRDDAQAFQATEIQRLESLIRVKDAGFDAKAEEQRHYFYAEVAKRDALLTVAGAQVDQVKAALNSATTELRNLKQTRWFRLREVLLFQPLSLRKLVRLVCIVAGAVVPNGLRSTIAPRLNRLFGFAGGHSGTVTEGSGAYVVKRRSNPAVDAPKIVHVIANFMTGGSSRLVVDIVEYLGHYHHVVLTSFNPSPPAYVGVDVEECRFPESVGPFIEYFRRVQPDLIHVHYWGDCDEPWYDKAINAAHQLGLPVLENINTPIAPFRSEAVARYVYVSDYVRSVFGDADARHVTVYPGSDFKLFTRRQNEYAPDDCVGMVYRLERDKLNEEAIRPFIRIAQLRPQTHILIVGGGSLLESFQAAVEDAGVSENFEFTGYVGYDRLPSLYKRMSLFLAPVWKESFGQVSPFAMSMKVPVVGYDVGAIGEIVGDQKLLAPAAEAEILAQIAVRLLDAPEQRREIGELQQKRAEEKFSIEAMIANYANLYAETIKNPRQENP